MTLCKLGIHKWAKQLAPLGCVSYGELDFRWCERCRKSQKWDANLNIWVEDNE